MVMSYPRFTSVMAIKTVVVTHNQNTASVWLTNYNNCESDYSDKNIHSSKTTKA